MTFGGPQILDCYLHSALPIKIYSIDTDCENKKKEKVVKKPKKTQKKPTPAKKTDQQKSLPIAPTNLRKKGRPSKK